MGCATPARPDICSEQRDPNRITPILRTNGVCSCQNTTRISKTAEELKNHPSPCPPHTLLVPKVLGWGTHLLAKLCSPNNPPLTPFVSPAACRTIYPYRDLVCWKAPRSEETEPAVNHSQPTTTPEEQMSTNPKPARRYRPRTQAHQLQCTLPRLAPVSTTCPADTAPPAPLRFFPDPARSHAQSRLSCRTL